MEGEMTMQPAAAGRGLAHTLKDDVYGMVLGVMFIAVGLNLLKCSGMITGGIAGIALLIAHVSTLPIGVLFFLVNLPFMVFCYVTMGRAFTLKTLIVNVALSAATQAVPLLLTVSYVHPLFAALVGEPSSAWGSCLWRATMPPWGHRRGDALATTAHRHQCGKEPDGAGCAGVCALSAHPAASPATLVNPECAGHERHADELAQAGPLSGELTAGLADGREGKRPFRETGGRKGLNGKKIILSGKTVWLRLNLLVFALLVALNRATP